MVDVFCIIIFTSAFSLFFSLYFPKVYKIELQKSIEQCNENYEVKSYPQVSVVIFALSGIVYFLSQDLALTGCCLLLGIMAYTDLAARWLPDVTIYLLLCLSFFTVHSKDVIESVISILFFIFPAIALNVFGFIRKKQQWIASGDFYVFPSVGLLVLPEYSAIIMILTLLIAVTLNLKFKSVPLITVLYFIFMGYQICKFCA